jgi:hypothetical protein
MSSYDTEFRLLYARERAERLRLDAQPAAPRRQRRRLQLLRRELPLLSPARRRISSLLPSS